MKPYQTQRKSITYNLKPLTLIFERRGAMKTKVFVLGLLFAVFFLYSLSYSQVPQMINYQGKLTTAQGGLVNGNYDMTFSIYSDSTGGTLLWTETQDSVSVENGIFSVYMGSVNPIPFDIWGSGPRYLGVTIGTTPEMTPRKLMASVPFAFTSAKGDCWDCTTISGVTYLIDPNDNVGIGTTSPAEYKLKVNGGDCGIYAVATQGSSTHRPFAVTADLNTSNSVTNGGGFGTWLNTANAPNIANVIGGLFSVDDPADKHVRGIHISLANEDADDYGLEIAYIDSPAYAIYSDCTGRSYFKGNVGIGNTNPQQKLHVTGRVEADEGSNGRISSFYAKSDLEPGITFDNTGSNYCDWTIFAGGGGGGSYNNDLTIMRTKLPYNSSDPGCANNGAVIFLGECHTVPTVWWEPMKVGISVTDPHYGLQLPNEADSMGTGMAYAWNTYSSIRWKENINPIDHALDKVLSLRGVYFDWRENKKHDIGMVAEEVGKVIPEVVTYEENGNDAQGLDYAKLTALLVEAMKEQQKEIDLLKAKIEKLEMGKR